MAVPTEQIRIGVSFFIMEDPQKEPVGVSESPHSEGEKKEVKAWLSTISNTEKWRNQKFERMGCKRFVNEYKGDWDFLQSSVSISLIPVNLVYSFVKTDVARMSFREPWITVNAKRMEDIGAAQIAEQIINYTWQELRLKQQIKQNIVEADLVGHSWLKIGYAAEFGTVESQPKEVEKGGLAGPPKSTRKSKPTSTSNPRMCLRTTCRIRTWCLIPVRRIRSRIMRGGWRIKW